MMMYLFSLLFLISLVFAVNMFWLVQSFLMVMSFMFITQFSFNYNYVSYFLGMDLLSSMMIMLSFWICSLKLIASEPIFMKKLTINCFLL